MLFDLRSRSRRNTVRVIYVFLALVMLAGLLLVGVGTGTNNGGILNAISNNGSGSNSTNNALYVKEVNQALKQTRQNPSSPSAWKSLLQARYTLAQASGNYNTSTGVFTASGKAELNKAVTDWTQYVKLTKNKPTTDAAILASRVYSGLGDYSGMASAYQYIVAAEPPAAAGGAYTCLAYTAYAAKDSQLGDLAAGKAIALAPKLQKLTLKTNLAAAKKTATTAQTQVVENNC